MVHSSKQSYKGKTILLADDDPDFLEQHKMYLEMLGFTVISAESQKAAEEIIGNGKYDIAVFDLMMENEDSGFVLAYKSKKKNPGAPVIIATSVTNETGMKFDAVTEESREWVKADIMLDKNLRFEQLERAINTLLPL